METELSFLIKNLHQARERNNLTEIFYSLKELSKFYFLNQDFPKAKKILFELREIKSSDFGVNYALGLIEIEEENYKKAIFYLQEELKYNPSHKQAEEILEKLVIKLNFPFVTLCIIFLSILFFYFFYENSVFYFLHFSLSEFNYSFFSIFLSIFFHSSFFHLFFNMFSLLLFGLILEKYIGSFYFFLVFIFGSFFGNLVEFLFMINSSFILGSSGGIFAILGALLMREPMLKIRVFGLIKMPLIFLLSFFISFYFLYLNLFGSLGFSNSADISHLVGFLFGILAIGIIYNKSISNFYSWLYISIFLYILFFSFFNIYTSIFLDSGNFIFDGFFIFNIFLIFISLIFLLFLYKNLKRKYLEVL